MDTAQRKLVEEFNQLYEEFKMLGPLPLSDWYKEDDKGRIKRLKEIVARLREISDQLTIESIHRLTAE